ncbi:hypothetical protein MAPG_07616 [Magnaporthiopsis poae ATCC 64411]|uniref:NAD-dependent epimerase/dehydratase domain-containing protein n=1 Tax=Magnaporthiopsis poae (strain ATCC 64411 / 73-15) TaxID=644358 RepID=A0A0C4E554_MAGP6|nr:hypothetical protein MAPG_07616 [Magnaporthiopsis poae ATCC 64411]
MASKPMVTALFGSTGLVGSHILTTLLASADFGTVHTISRREPKQATTDGGSSTKLAATVEPATDKWAASIATLDPRATAVVSAVGTTRAAAGGIANQWKIDHDLNVELARAAKAAGARVFVFVSSGGTRGLLASASPWAKMKNGVEDCVKEQGFDNAVILRPGLIVGQRESHRSAEGLFQSLANGIGSLSQGAKDAFAQDADVIARAAVAALCHVNEGTAPDKYWVLEQADIVRLGRNEWKEPPN